VAVRERGPYAPSALTGRTFRIQFRAEADVARGVWAGRIEHLRSGDAAHFASIDELLAFVASWLAGDDR
jgi:hypothetical protein